VAVLVREHPGAPLSDEQRATMTGARNVRMVPAEEFSLREVLDAVDVAVSIYSTSLLEGAALGTPAVIFNPTSLPPLEPDLAAIGAGARAGDADEALGAIVRIMTDEEHRERLRAATATVRQHYFAGGDANDAARRVAEAIETREAVAR
jgi:NADPH-dependent glutamate synthase beta subunit-like oxidoreductase